LKETLIIAVNQKENLAKSISVLSLVVLALFAAFSFFPTSIADMAYQYKHLILAGTLIIYFSAHLLYQHRGYMFTAVDFWWTALIAYTMLSMLWGASAANSINNAFHFLILYLIFKAFENISWEGTNTRKTFFTLSLLAFSLLILFQIVYIFQSGLLEGQPIYNDGIVHFVPCLLSVIILPYVVFTKENISNYLVAFLFAVNLWTAWILEMPQAIIVLLILVISYILFKLTYTQSIKYLVLLGFLSILGFSLFYTVNSKFSQEISTGLNPAEFKSAVYMHDMQHMIEQIGVSPIVGHGSGSLSSLSIHEPYPNNLVLSILAELGLIGLIMFCYIALFPIIRLFNERNILSTLELSAVVSVVLFFFLSLFYGEMYTKPSFLATSPIIAIIGLAQISKKGNANTLISETSHKGASVILLCLAVGCLVYYLGSPL